MKFVALVVFAVLSFCSLAIRAAVLEPPVFNRAAGTVPTGFAFMLTNLNSSGAVMFTTDGADPRTPAGTVYTNARALWAPVTVNRTTTVKARVLRNADWSDMVEATFVASNDYTRIIISELMYQPPGTNGAHERSREWVELKNTGTEVLDLSGVEFRGFVFPQGSQIGPGEFKVLPRNPNVFALDHPGVRADGFYLVPLLNDDATVTLNHASGAVMFSMSYGTFGPWPTTPDDHNFTEKGFSLVPVDPNNIAHPHSYHSWRPSSFEGGSPGMDDPPETRQRIFVNELLARPGGVYPFEAVEFYNPSSEEVDIGYWFLTDSRRGPKQYHIPANTIVPAQGYLVLDSRQLDSNPSNRVAFGTYESVYLYSANSNRNLTGLSHGYNFLETQPGVSLGRVLNSVGDEFFFPQRTHTIGGANAGPTVGPLVISEVMYHPLEGEPQYVEFVNVTDDAYPLEDIQDPWVPWEFHFSGWEFLPTNVIVEPRGMILKVSEDPDVFRARYDVPDNVVVIGGLQTYPGYFPSELVLYRPSGWMQTVDGNLPRDVPVDAVDFGEHYPWPAAANGSGASLQRLVFNEFGNDPKNWRASHNISPGRPNFASPLDGWREWHFTPAELADPATAGDNADPDDDGLNNVTEYAFNLDPKSPGRLPVRIEIFEGYLTATVVKNMIATDIDIIGESAGALDGPWSSADVETGFAWPDTILRDRVPNASTRFLRISVVVRR